jgi:hypothetical protein
MKTCPADGYSSEYTAQASRYHAITPCVVLSLNHNRPVTPPRTPCYLLRDHRHTPQSVPSSKQFGPRRSHTPQHKSDHSDTGSSDASSRPAQNYQSFHALQVASQEPKIRLLSSLARLLCLKSPRPWSLSEPVSDDGRSFCRALSSGICPCHHAIESTSRKGQKLSASIRSMPPS